MCCLAVSSLLWSVCSSWGSVATTVVFVLSSTAGVYRSIPVSFAALQLQLQTAVQSSLTRSPLQQPPNPGPKQNSSIHSITTTTTKNSRSGCRHLAAIGVTVNKAVASVQQQQQHSVCVCGQHVEVAVSGLAVPCRFLNTGKLEEGATPYRSAQPLSCHYHQHRGDSHGSPSCTDASSWCW